MPFSCKAIRSNPRIGKGLLLSKSVKVFLKNLHDKLLSSLSTVTLYQVYLHRVQDACTCFVSLKSKITELSEEECSKRKPTIPYASLEYKTAK